MRDDGSSVYGPYGSWPVFSPIPFGGFFLTTDLVAVLVEQNQQLQSKRQQHEDLLRKEKNPGGQIALLEVHIKNKELDLALPNAKARAEALLRAWETYSRAKNDKENWSGAADISEELELLKAVNETFQAFSQIPHDEQKDLKKLEAATAQLTVWLENNKQALKKSKRELNPYRYTRNAALFLASACLLFVILASAHVVPLAAVTWTGLGAFFIGLAAWVLKPEPSSKEVSHIKLYQSAERLRDACLAPAKKATKSHQTQVFRRGGFFTPAPGGSQRGDYSQLKQRKRGKINQEQIEMDELEGRWTTDHLNSKDLEGATEYTATNNFG